MSSAPVPGTEIRPESETRAVRPGPGSRGRAGVMGIVAQVFLAVWAALVILPLVWTIYTSFKDNREIFTSPWALPSTLRWSNFSKAWNSADIGRYFANTVVVVVGGVVLTLLLSSMVAYVLARYTFFGNRIIYYLFIAGMTFPVFLAIVPLFFVARNFGMTDSRPGLIVIYAAFSLPFSVFFLTAFFRTLPSQLAEAAFIDGCGHYSTFFRVMLPLAKPGLISIGIFNVLGQWNQYLLPLVLETDDKNYVLTQGLAQLAVSQGYRSEWGQLFAGLTITLLPVLVVYALFQRHVQSGMTAGALK